VLSLEDAAQLMDLRKRGNYYQAGPPKSRCAAVVGTTTAGTLTLTGVRDWGQTVFGDRDAAYRFRRYRDLIAISVNAEPGEMCSNDEALGRTIDPGDWEIPRLAWPCRCITLPDGCWVLTCDVQTSGAEMLGRFASPMSDRSRLGVA
jgi:hypothetical protein